MLVAQSMAKLSLKFEFAQLAVTLLLILMIIVEKWVCRWNWWVWVRITAEFISLQGVRHQQKGWNRPFLLGRWVSVCTAVGPMKSAPMQWCNGAPKPERLNMRHTNPNLQFWIIYYAQWVLYKNIFCDTLPVNDNLLPTKYHSSAFHKVHLKISKSQWTH